LPHVVRRALPLALALVLLPAAAAHAAAPDEVVPGEVVVRFAPDTSASARSAALDAVDADGSTATRLPDTRLVALDEDADVRAAARRLQARDDVLWAEPNYVVHADRVPNDPRFGELWGLDNTGQVVEQTTGPGLLPSRAGDPGDDINVLPAWDLTTGSASVRIGVVDTGIAHHEDLDANLDTTRSRDFITASGDPFADPDSHGTHVAGTIGAVGNNGIGVSGVMWNADLLALRTLDAGGGTSLSIAAAFSYAGQIGLPIVNASLGMGANSQAVHDAITLASNTLFVVAAGNDNIDVDATPQYPCAFPDANVVCVASLDNNDDRSWFSNYGATQVDLGAPGNQILSTVPEYDNSAITVDGSWADAGANGNWSFDGTKWTTPLAPEMDTTLTPPNTIDLTGRAGCSAAVTWSGDFQPGEAAMILERQAQGLWEPIGTRYQPLPSGGTERFGLKADDQSDVQLRVRVISAPGVDPADITVSGLSWRCVRPGSSTVYQRLSGTSMATPHVAGVAGLLKSAHPELTVAQLRTALLSTVTPVASLAGKTVTGGRVNVTAALASLTPAPPAPSGGGSSAPAPAPTPPVPDPVPVTVPTPVTPQTPATPAAVPTSRPRATLQPNAGRLLRRGVLTVRTAVSQTSTVRARATLRWRGGHARLRTVTRRGLKPGSIATLRLRSTAATRRALRAAARDGRRVRVRVVLTIIAADGTTRHITRTLTTGPARR
jgi:subtilisin family serine protease